MIIYDKTDSPHGARREHSIVTCSNNFILVVVKDMNHGDSYVKNNNKIRFDKEIIFR